MKTGPAWNTAWRYGARTIPRTTALIPTWESSPGRHPVSNIATRMEFRIKCTDSRMEVRTPYESQGPPLHPSRSSCSLRDNGSYVEPPHSFDVPGTAHGTPHGIPYPVLKSTRNSGSHT